MSLPLDFSAALYRELNEDLSNLDDTEITLHYLLQGHKEGRAYKSGCPKHVVVSIATYKNEEVLNDCLDSIGKKTEYKNFTVVVTDNALDKRIEYIVYMFKARGLNIEYVGNQRNEYFSRPHNKVISRFKKSDIIVLNDDTIIRTKCWIRELQESAYASNRVACCCGKALTPDKKLEEAGSILLKNGYGVYIGQYDDPNKEFYNKRRSVGFCSGSLLYLRRDAIEKIGLFDEELKPLYYEDTDWQFRAHLLGLEVIYEPRCVYTHIGRSTTGYKLSEYANLAREVFMRKFKEYDLEAFNEMTEKEAQDLLK